MTEISYIAIGPVVALTLGVVAVLLVDVVDGHDVRVTVRQLVTKRLTHEQLFAMVFLAVRVAHVHHDAGVYIRGVQLFLSARDADPIEVRAVGAAAQNDVAVGIARGGKFSRVDA